MLCKLIESVTYLCILIAVMKYMDGLPEQTLIDAQESNTAQVKLTARERESCTVPEGTDSLAEGNKPLP